MVENVSGHQAVCAFKEGVRYRELILKFGRSGAMTLNRMMEIATRYANGEEEDRLHSGKGKATDPDTGGGNPSRKQKRKAEAIGQTEAAVVTTQGKFKGKPKGSWIPKKIKDWSGQDVLDLPCAIHTKKDEEGNLILPKHTTRQYRFLIQQFHEGQQCEKGSDKDEDEEKAEDYPKVNATLVICADVESKSRLKVINREVNMVALATTTYLKWSKTPITFDQSDHPAQVATPRQQALVVDPIIRATLLRKVLMDGGSGLNILCVETLLGMGILMS